ncbi:MAG: flagellar type III secretion system protein FlhB [Leptospiraceae bacterium]|nr:flagellar type III secretion system protein FlhB [Leptospiraceae bacterium]MCP5510702.1 flagellar type III secretion system protein FlhB [Leptospiraceae bacterium]
MADEIIELFPDRIHLQLFAAEDEGRTEEGSERRRKEERDKGNVPKSQELPAALILLTSMATVYLLGGYLFERSFYIFRKYFENVHNYNSFADEDLRVLFRASASDIMGLLFPVLGISFLMAIVGNLVQVGFIYTPKALTPNFTKIIPNFKKVLPTRQVLFNLAKSLAKVALVGWVSYIIISMDFLPMLLLGNMGLKAAIHLLAKTALKIFIVIGVLFFAISILDYFYQKYEFEESIKMTPSESKQEMKETEGDKTFLNRRRQMVREFLRKGMLQRIPKADVVVVNPTHFSVALAYDPKIHNAPVVSAKGMDELALLMRRLAKKHNVPIIEDRIVARMLYDEVEVDAEIPSRFFKAVSLIISRLDKYRRVA